MANSLKESQKNDFIDEWRTIQRIIIPDTEENVDNISLYIDISNKIPQKYTSSKECIIPEGGRFSFATYFNAFPASYWRRWTTVENIRLVIKTIGDGILTVNRSNAKGSQQKVASAKVNGGITSVFNLSLTMFCDGGWYWFDIISTSKNFKFIEAYWQAPNIGISKNYSIGITTFNRPQYCINILKNISSNITMRNRLKEIIIVDQGNEKVQNEREFSKIKNKLGSQLRIINQENIGGSGGFSRCMYETVKSNTDYLILLDDDIVIEPESFLRLVDFSDYTRVPTIVGGHMFDMYNRSSLHTFGEVVDQYRFLPALPNDQMRTNHDFNVSSLRKTKWLHRRIDVDYTGWWMCLIPVDIMKKIGLSLPLFIKWDDVEYGLRAQKAGYPTVSLPGAAVWHVSWSDKDDLVGWQAYFHIRNRMIVSLIHSGYKMGGRIIRESQYEDIKHIMSMQYYTQAGRIKAMEDLLKGSKFLHKTIKRNLTDILNLKTNYSDALFLSEPNAFPLPNKGKLRKKIKIIKKHIWGIKSIPTIMKIFIYQLKNLLVKGSPKNPEAIIAFEDAKWYNLSQYSSVIVSNADGTAASWHRKNPKLGIKQFIRSVILHFCILAKWLILRKEFNESLNKITSIESWEKTFNKVHSLKKDGNIS